MKYREINISRSFQPVESRKVGKEGQACTRQISFIGVKYPSSRIHLSQFLFPFKISREDKLSSPANQRPATWEVSILRVHWPPFNSDLWPRFRIQYGAVVAHRSEIMRGCPNGTNRGRFNLISSQPGTSFSNDQREERSTLPSSIDSSFPPLSLLSPSSIWYRS